VNGAIKTRILPLGDFKAGEVAVWTGDDIDADHAKPKLSDLKNGVAMIMT